MPKVEYDIVDYFKFFFAICIVGIHANIFADSLVYPLVFRIAVPYFFVSSGFFFGKKLWNEKLTYNFKSKVGGGVNRLAIKILIFEPISIVLITCQLIRQNTPWNEIAEQLVKHILFYPYGALWYIQALIVAFVISYIFLKKFKILWLLVVSFCLYIFALLCNNYYFLSEYIELRELIDGYFDIFVSPRNGLFVGLFFVSAGIAISKYELKIRSLKRVRNYVLILASLYLIIEAYLLQGVEFADDGGLFLSYSLFVPVLFISTISNSSIKLPFARKMRNLSTSIYLLHRPLLMILLSLSFNITGVRFAPGIAFTATLALSIIFSLLAYMNERLYKILT